MSTIQRSPTLLSARHAALRRLRRVALIAILFSLAPPLLCTVAYMIMPLAVPFTPDRAKVEHAIQKASFEERADLIRVSWASAVTVLNDTSKIAVVLVLLSTIPLGLIMYVLVLARRLARLDPP